MSAFEPSETVTDLCAFIDASPSPYHAVAEAVRRLERAGYRRFDERSPWELGPGSKGYLVRGGGTLLAFCMGTEPPARAGFRILGAHTDSPNLRLKPNAERKKKGHRQLAVAPYGGVLLHTWLDRDLSIAGRVTLLDGSTHLVNLETPLCRVSNLAIHLYPTLATEGLQLNPQTHLVPTMGLDTKDASELSTLIAKAIGEETPGVTKEEVAAFDLCLYDVQPARVGGADGEMLYAARLDNLASCHAALAALVDGPDTCPGTRVAILYDHEEIGSQSAAGARSRFFVSVLERLARGVGSERDAGDRALSSSLLVSADMAHAIHPNYEDRHDPEHLPKLSKGPVVKINANQAYATDAPTAALFERVARRVETPTQSFVSRNDYRCGSTIGPISAAQTGIRTLDVGNPMLSMHSCREVSATADVPSMIAVLGELLVLPEVPSPED